MRPYRNLKIASVLRAELNQIILKDIEFEGAMVTITGVEISPDLREAKIKLGILPYEKGPAALQILEKRRKALQHKLLKKMNIKPMPQIRFEMDLPARAGE